MTSSRGSSEGAASGNEGRGINWGPAGSTEAVTGLPFSSTAGKSLSAAVPTSQRPSRVMPMGTTSYLAGSERPQHGSRRGQRDLVLAGTAAEEKPDADFPVHRIFFRAPN